MPNPWILYCRTEEEWLSTAVEDLVLRIQKVLEKFPECRLGVAGGSTPLKVYEKLAQQPLPWEKIKVIQLDERYVPSDHGESNLKALHYTLLDQAPLPPQNIFAFDTTLPYVSVAEEMERRLRKLKNPERPLLDVLVLGAGADGHIASLFEGEAATKSPNFVSTAQAQGYATPERITLTLKALQEASSALLLLKGKEKGPVLLALKGEATEPKLTVLKALLPHTKLKILAYLQ